MKHLLFTLSLVLMASFGWSQCEIGFTATVSNDTVTLVPYDSSSSIGYNVWNAPGGSPSTQSLYITTTATVEYNSVGGYEICVTLYDSGWSCVDTFCDSIFITNSGGGSTLSSSATSTNTSCGGCNGTATVTASGGTSPYYYYWSNGSVGATATGLCAGTYTATVIDNDSNVSTTAVTVNGTSSFTANIAVSNANPCTGSTVTLTAQANSFGVYTYNWNNGDTAQSINVTTSGSYWVQITDSNGCTSEDSIYLGFTSGPALTLSSTDETCASCCNGTATASATGTGLSYAWSNSATTSTITGLCPGTYTVTVSDTTGGCNSIDSVYINAYVASCYTIAGEIAQGEFVKVYLIEEDSSILYLNDSVNTDSLGNYAFNNVCNGTYYVAALLLPAHAGFNYYIPTYYDSAALWTQSTSIVINNASIYSIDFACLSGNNAGGSSYIGGNVSQGSNRGEGDPIKNVYVAAYNEDGTLAAFAKTDANGDYTIDNLSVGTYLVYVDVLNKTAYPHEVPLTSEIPASTNRDFEILGDIVRPIAPVGIDDIAADMIEIYPNPADDFVTVDFGTLNVTSISMINILGERVMQEKVNNSTSIQFSLEGLAPGSYMIELNGEGFSNHQPIIIK